MAATMFAHRTEGFDIVSAGTHVIEGLPMSIRTRRALAMVGHENKSHLSHQLVAADVAGADLIVAMEPGHLTYLEREFPEARRRAGMFPRIVALLEAAEITTDEPLGSLIDRVGLGDAAHVDADEVIDPAGGEQPEFDASAIELDALVDRLVGVLGVARKPSVVSLVPAATDLVFALGHGAGVLAVSHECDHPKVGELPRATSSSIDAAGTIGGADPGEVDRAVAEALAAGDALYITDRELLARLAPKVVVAQEICDVCAVSGPAVAGILPDGTELVNLTATSINGLFADIDVMAQALDRLPEAERLKATITERLAAAQKAGDKAAAEHGGRPQILTLEWADPPFLGGHWVPELVQRAGGENVLSELGQPSRRSSWDEIRDARVDIVVGMQCGYEIDVAGAELRAAIDQGVLDVPSGGVWATDATRLFSRCTTNVTEAVEVLLSLSGGTEIPGVAHRIA